MRCCQPTVRIHLLLLAGLYSSFVSGVAFALSDQLNPEVQLPTGANRTARRFYYLW
jgi:hypothetical protein